MATPLAPAESGTDLAALCDAVLPVWSRQLTEAQTQSSAAVHEMLAAFGDIHAVLGRLSVVDGDAHNAGGKGAPADLSAQIERMYRGFQYEDRVSQMLALLRQDMDRLLEAIAQDSALPPPSQWLDRLHSEYAMSEQRALHHNASDKHGNHTPGAGNADAIDFF